MGDLDGGRSRPTPRASSQAVQAVANVANPYEHWKKAAMRMGFRRSPVQIRAARPVESQTGRGFRLASFAASSDDRGQLVARSATDPLPLWGSGGWDYAIDPLGDLTSAPPNA